MLDLKYVAEHLEDVRASLLRRNAAAAATLDRIALLSVERKEAITRLEGARNHKNQASQDMAKMDKSSPAFAEKRDELKRFGEEVKAMEERSASIAKDLEDLLLYVPNLPHEDVPEGKDEHGNVVVKTWGNKPEFAFEPKDHHDVGVGLGILDFERAAKISGARFSILRKSGARLERALMQFMLDVHSNEHGYEEVWPPALVLGTSLRGTGNLPKFEADLFRLVRPSEQANESNLHESEARDQDLFLIPTAEVPVTNFHRDEILEDAQLPITYCAYTPCFRSEAGSYGKDTRGLIRQHQFDKVELVRFCKGDVSVGLAELEKLRMHAESILEKLGLHYRTVLLCAGDMSANAKKCYDLEVWLPGQNAYREISSCSWFGDFQARRANIRSRNAAGEKPTHVHTLNGSALAIGRTLVAILEQGQQADGSVIIPSALRPYMGGLERITL